MVAGAHRAELDRRHPDPQEGDRVGGAVAPDAHRLAVVVRRAAASRSARTKGESRSTTAGGRLNSDVDLGVGNPAHLLEHRRGVLVGEVADVDVDHASVGHLVERVAARGSGRG